MQQRQPSRPARFGSQVITGDDTGNDRAEQPDAGPSGVLRLRGAPPRDAPRVQWGNDVVDNENMGKKKSKICCIYHKPKAFDESSSDDSSSDASDADSSGDDKDKDESNHGDAGQEAQGEHSSQQPSACGHHHHHRKSKGKHKHKQKGSSSGSVVEIDKGKRNAYEVQPGSKD